MSVARCLLKRLDFGCQMQGSWVSIKGADVPAELRAEDQSLLYAPTHNQK
jgi:hypothetical protein